MPQLSWHTAHWESGDKTKNISFSKSRSLVTVSRTDLMMHRSAKSWFHVMKNNHMSNRFLSRHLFMPGAFVLKTFTGNVCFYTLCSIMQSHASGIFNMHNVVHFGTQVALPNSSDAFRDLPIINRLCSSQCTRLSCKKCKPGSRGSNPIHVASLVLRLFHLCEEHQDKRWIIISS